MGLLDSISQGVVKATEVVADKVSAAIHHAPAATEAKSTPVPSAGKTPPPPKLTSAQKLDAALERSDAALTEMNSCGSPMGGTSTPSLAWMEAVKDSSGAEAANDEISKHIYKANLAIVGLNRDIDALEKDPKITKDPGKAQKLAVLKSKRESLIKRTEAYASEWKAKGFAPDKVANDKSKSAMSV